jgi:transposase
MLHLAMDISKEEVVFYADRLQKHFEVPNTAEAIQAFLQQQAFDPQTTLVGCEATGDYHMQACLAVLEFGYPVKVLNPILTKKVIKATIRKKKTDFSDAEIIAKLLADGHGEIVTKETFQQTKRTSLRVEQKLVALASDLKRIKKSLQEKGKVMDVKDPLEAIEHCLQVIGEEAEVLVKKATEEQDRQEEIIDSVPGCGEKLAAIISAEAGDIKRFPSARQLKAYAGIDPKVSQSGNRSYTGPMTKRGNTILRHALFLAANIARIYDPDMKAFYEKKRAEGKSYRLAICAVSRKLCERIYAIVLKNELYAVKPMQKTP